MLAGTNIPPTAARSEASTPPAIFWLATPLKGTTTKSICWPQEAPKTISCRRTILSNPVQGTAVGPKVRGDIYINPTPRSVFSGEAEYTTAFQTYWTSAKYGYDVFSKGFFIGPEVVAFGDERLISGGLALI